MYIYTHIFLLAISLFSLSYLFMSKLLLLSHAASSLKFDDPEKQKKYEKISFEEIHNEVIKLKVSPI